MSSIQVQTVSCPVCQSGNDALEALVSKLRGEGRGYKYTWGVAVEQGFTVTRDQMQEHCAHVERTVMSAHADAEDRGEEKTLEWYKRHGIDELPPGFVAGTIAISNGTHTSWFRTKAEQAQADRVEVRQAEPVVIDAPPVSITLWTPGTWQTWMVTPDLQCGYWLDNEGNWHTIHDERAVDVTHQIGLAIAMSEGLHGWLDVGDFLDLAALSTHNPGKIDLYVGCLNKSFQRGSEILATRRYLVGENGELVVLEGNHDIRFPKMTQERMPYLVGLRRADDPEDEFPVLSVPYMCRFRDHGVVWYPSYPGGFVKLNSNLVAFHAPAYSSKALESARKISNSIHSSTIFGHVHRRESLAQNIETAQGTRTLEVWSDGTLARLDGSVPSSQQTYDDQMNRVIQTRLQPKAGLLAENWHQGFSIVHVEVDGRERFSREPIVIWDGWAQWRGETFESTVDIEGNSLADS